MKAKRRHYCVISFIRQHSQKDKTTVTEEQELLGVPGGAVYDYKRDSMREFFRAHRTVLYHDCGDGYKNLYMH